MNNSLHLQIPNPCRENWANMRPGEKGRHCAACQKTVVDFTKMADADIVGYLALAGPHVCGRLLPDQLNRRLAALPPPQKNGLSGWRWLLAGLLLIDKDTVSHRPAKPGPRQQEISRESNYLDHSSLGMILAPISDTDFGRVELIPAKQTIAVVECSGEVMEDIGLTVPDSICEPPDSILPRAILPRVETTDLPTESTAVHMDTITPRLGLADSLKEFVTDTLTALRLIPKNELIIYPNPVRRGGSVRLSGLNERSAYRVAVFSASGGLLQERILKGGGAAPVYSMPASIASGVYLIQVVRQGQSAGFTRELVVE